MDPTRIAIVTGASRGLGAALATELLARGWNVVGVGRSAAPPFAEPRLRYVQHDLADVPGIAPALGPALTQAAAGAPQRAVLVNNAAVAGPTGVFGDLDPGEIVRSLAVNLAAAAALADLFCRAFDDATCERRIVNVSSGAADHPIPGAGLYCMAKAGLEMLTRVLAAEHAEPAFQAVTLRPGIIDTDMQVYMRTRSAERLPAVDMFRGFHASGQLVPAAVVAAKVIERLIEAPVVSGRTYTYASL